MPTQDQVLNLSFNQGIETKVDLKQGVNGRLLTLVNAVFTGVTSIEKRFGYNVLPVNVLNYNTSNTIGSLPNISNGNSLGTFNGALTLFDSKLAYSFSIDENAWVYDGMKIATGISTQSLTGLATTQFWPALSYNNANIKFLISPTNIASSIVTNFSVQWQASWFDVNKNVLLSTYVAPLTLQAVNVKTVALGTKFIAQISSLTQTQLYSFNQTPPDITPNSTTPITNGTSPDIVSSGTYIYTAIYDGANLFITQYDSTLTVINIITITIVATVINLNLTYDSVNNILILAYTYIGGYTVSKYNASTLALVNSVNHVDASIGAGAQIAYATDGLQTAIFYDLTPTAGDNSIKAVFFDGISTTKTYNFGYDYVLYSKAFFQNGTAYVSLIFTGDYVTSPYNNPLNSALEVQTGMMLVGVNLINFTAPARIAYDETYLFIDYDNFYSPSQLQKNPRGLVQWANNSLPYFNAVQDLGIIIPEGATAPSPPVIYNVSEADLTFGDKLRNLSLGKNLNITGGTSFVFDGGGVAEQGFNTYPEIINIATNSSGSGHSYNYVAIYTWYDLQANLHRSAVSIGRPIVTTNPIGSTGGTAQNTILVTAYGLGEPYKVFNVNVELYRTTDNGSIYFRVATGINALNHAVSIADNTPDVNIVGAQQLYTMGGEVDNTPPPAFHLITEFKNRMILVNNQDPLQWWYSKQVIEGFPVEFSDLFTQNIDQKGGSITALSTMDDKLVFFKESNVWYVFGDGPAPNGQNNDFTYPQIISSDTGCVNQDSIILTPKGLMFQSPKGIYLLDRQLDLSYIGAPVEAFNSSLVTSTQMISYTNQIRFSLNSGVVLCYDYYVNQWSVFNNIAATDSTIYNNTYTYLQSNGLVNLETPNQYLDNGVVIPMSFTTGWIKLSDLQGFERLKKLLFLGLSSGATTISTSFNYDYNTIDNRPITPISISGSITRLQERLFPPRQKGEAFQLVFNETPATSSAGLTSLSGLALEIGMKKGPFKLPASNSYG